MAGIVGEAGMSFRIEVHSLVEILTATEGLAGFIPDDCKHLPDSTAKAEILSRLSKRYPLPEIFVQEIDGPFGMEVSVISGSAVLHRLHQLYHGEADVAFNANTHRFVLLNHLGEPGVLPTPALFCPESLEAWLQTACRPVPCQYDLEKLQGAYRAFQVVVYYLKQAPAEMVEE